MQVRVKVCQILPAVSGISKSTGKPWSGQCFIGETYDERPRKICFKVFNGKIAIPAIESDITVDFDLDSRSWADKSGELRWSTDVNAYNVTIHQPGIETAYVPQPAVQIAPTPAHVHAVSPAGPSHVPAAFPAAGQSVSPSDQSRLAPQPDDSLPF